MPKDAKYANLVLSRLSRRYGKDLHTQLGHRDMCELFVAVFLSPQCTDKQVNKVTVELFKKFRSFKDYANCDIRKLMRAISGINYYKTKARNLKKSAKMIVEKFDGKVPNSLAQLMELPGVGRKVANVILEEGYDIHEGIAVDTHCGRVARRLGFSRKKDPFKIEKSLMNSYDPKDWGEVSNSFIELGRDVCHARNRECQRCVLKDICPSAKLA